MIYEYFDDQITQDNDVKMSTSTIEPVNDLQLKEEKVHIQKTKITIDNILALEKTLNNSPKISPRTKIEKAGITDPNLPTYEDV